MAKNFILWTLAVLSVMSCSSRLSRDEYVDWLYESMPLPDSLTYDRNYWETNVERTLKTDALMDWGIPEREFRHFVLPLRANNETLDDFRTIYADTLCARVKGMSLMEAAIEINHWCHEQATYKPSDSRTSSPTATMRNGVGRCGEESVLAVAALRAAGIPARQVYTPRWAHTDDNHAWVEVWVDGKWYFMGACEPEPRLNMAWFNAPVSRAMLLNTKVFGDYHGCEDVLRRTNCYTEINAIRGYVPARRTSVRILDAEGHPVEGAEVEFKIYNYAEFYTVARYVSDAEGRAALDTGCGDVFIWAAKDGIFGFGKASEGEAEVILSHRMDEIMDCAVDIVPPVEDPIRSGATEEEIAENARRLAEEDAIRSSHDHSNPAVEAYRKYSPEKAEVLLPMLCAKDLCDISAEMLADIDICSSDYYILSPRVANEFLLPHRQEILASGLRLSSVDEVIAWTRDNIRIIEGRNPQNLSIAPLAVWRSKMSDRKSRNIFFVALCRCFGFPARIDEITGKTQYRESGVWKDVEFGETALTSTPKMGRLTVSYKGDAVGTPKYYRHFTISRIEEGKARLLEFGSDADDTPVTLFKGVELEEGYYLLTSGSRMADGSVLANMQFFTVSEDETTEIELDLRNTEDKIAVIGSMDAEQKFLCDGSDNEQSILSATGRGYFLLAVMGEKDEPSTHARLDMAGSADLLNAWGRPMVFLEGSAPEGLDKTIHGSDPDSKVLDMLLRACEKSSRTLPVITVCDSFGRIVYFSQGYNTSLAADLQRIINGIR